jgi:hypothetical protein
MNTPKLKRERDAIVRANILDHIRAYTQVSLSDLCREFEIDEASAVVHLQALRAKKEVHRACAFSSPSTLSQIWTVGELGDREAGGSFEPIQVTIRHWAGEAQAFHRTTLEHLLCFARSQAEVV